MTKIRSSNQLYVDDHFQVNSKKVQLVSAGTEDTDAVNLGQLNSAVLGLNNSIHAPVADLTSAKAVPSSEIVDKELMLIETLGLYRWDAESTAASNDNTIIRPTFVASDAAAGRWYKMSSTITDHNNLSGLQGGEQSEYFHLTSEELAKLTGIESNADVTDKENVAGAFAASPDIAAATVDADQISVLTGGVIKRLSFTNLKVFLKTYFDTLYNNYVHPNHSGDVTSTSDGATVIGASKVLTGMINDKAVTLGKQADIATSTLLGRVTPATGQIEVLTIAQVKALLGLSESNQSVRTYRAIPSGLINSTNTVFTVPALVLSGTEEVFKNGQLLDLTVDYSIAYGATTTITMASAPLNAATGGYADKILVNYSV